MCTVLDSEELTYQMAYDVLQSDERAAARKGVPGPGALRVASPRRRLRLDDPDILDKLDRFFPPASGS